MTTPSPDAFTPLPSLSDILARLRPPPSPGHPTASPAPATPLPGTTAASPSGAGGGGPLSLKEVPAATDPIKHRLQRARQQVRTLPDVDRGVGEQEAEMEELRARIRRQREVLRVLREVGIRFGKGDEPGVGGKQQGKEEGGMVMR